MANYLKIFKTYEDYDKSLNKPTIGYCVLGVEIHNANSYNYGSEDDDPTEDNIDGGFYCS